MTNEEVFDILNYIQLVFHENELENNTDLAVNEEKLKALIEKKEEEKEKLRNVQEKNNRRYNKIRKSAVELKEKKLDKLEQKEKDIKAAIYNLENSKLVTDTEEQVAKLNADIKEFREMKEVYEEEVKNQKKKIETLEEKYNTITDYDEILKDIIKK